MEVVTALDHRSAMTVAAIAAIVRQVLPSYVQEWFAELEMSQFHPMPGALAEFWESAWFEGIEIVVITTGHAQTAVLAGNVAVISKGLLHRRDPAMASPPGLATVVPAAEEAPQILTQENLAHHDLCSSWLDGRTQPLAQECK